MRHKTLPQRYIISLVKFIRIKKLFRNRFKLMSTLLLITFTTQLFTIYGCNGDNGGVIPNPTPTTTTVTGTVNTSEIGGSGLQVQSFFRQNCSVSNGQYTTEVSNTGTQLLFITDGSQQVRGLTLSKITNGTPVPIIGDATSTASSLLFMVPGILATEPDTTTNRLNRLHQLNSFQQFSNHLKNNLPANTLGNLMNQQQTKDLYLQTVLEFTGLDTNTFSSDKHRNNKRRNNNKSHDNNKNRDNDPNFIVNKVNVTTLELINRNWRDVNVFRRDLKSDGSQLGNIHNTQTPMKGAIPYSFGCFFTNTCFNPTIKYDNSFAQINQEVTISDYWVVGPGLQPNIQPPNGLNTDITIPIISSLVSYMFYPLISLVTGGFGFLIGLQQNFEASLEVARSLSKEANIIIAAGNIATAQNVTAFSSAVVNALFNPLVFTTVVNSLAAFGIISSATASSLIALLPIIVTVNLSFVIANAIIMGILVAASPKYSKYSVFISPTLLSPLNGSTNQTLTPILKCNPVIGATNYNFQVSTSSSFNNLLVNANSTLPQYSVLSNTLSGNTKYYWRVNATVSSQISRWSSVWNFTTQTGGGGGNWSPLGSGFNNNVWALTVYNGELIAGGSFTTAGGVNAKSIAKWNGNSWAPLGSGLESGTSSPCVRAFTIYNGELIVGGIFTTAGGVNANNIAKWNGSSWSSLGSGMNYDGVYTLTVYNSELIAGGIFTTAGGVYANNIAKWNGSSWSPLSSGLNGMVEALIVYNGNLIAGGSFYINYNFNYPCLAKWNGITWATMHSGISGAGAGPWVSCFDIYQNNLIIGGIFSYLNGVLVWSIAKWDGTSYYALGSGMGSQVSCLTKFNTDLIAGGWFETAGGINANYIAKWNGSSWFPLGSGMNWTVEALTVYNGELIAGGLFTTAGGISANRIAKWNGN